MSKQIKFKVSVEGMPPPHYGETIGVRLIKAAESILDHDASVRAIMYEMAADAFRIASGCSLGHSRAERYEDQARACMSDAERARAVAQRLRDEEDARWKARTAAAG